MHARFAILSSRFYVFLPILYAKIIMLHKARYVKKNWGRKGEEVPTKKKKPKKKNPKNPLQFELHHRCQGMNAILLVSTNSLNAPDDCQFYANKVLMLFSRQLSFCFVIQDSCFFISFNYTDRDSSDNSRYKDVNAK